MARPSGTLLSKFGDFRTFFPRSFLATLVLLFFGHKKSLDLIFYFIFVVETYCLNMATFPRFDDFGAFSGQKSFLLGLLGPHVARICPK